VVVKDAETKTKWEKKSSIKLFTRSYTEGKKRLLRDGIPDAEATFFKIKLTIHSTTSRLNSILSENVQKRFLRLPLNNNMKLS